MVEESPGKEATLAANANSVLASSDNISMTTSVRLYAPVIFDSNKIPIPDSSNRLDHRQIPRSASASSLDLDFDSMIIKSLTKSYVKQLLQKATISS